MYILEKKLQNGTWVPECKENPLFSSKEAGMKVFFLLYGNTTSIGLNYRLKKVEKDDKNN
jgi:hypothetical protein